MKTPMIFLGRGIEMSIQCPEFNIYHFSKNVLYIVWIFAIIIGLFSYRKKSMTLLLIFIFFNACCLIGKSSLEVYLIYQPGPCNSVLEDIIDFWQVQEIFVDSFDGYMFEWNFSCWNTFITLILGVGSLFFSLFIRRKSFGYTQLETPSFTLN